LEIAPNVQCITVGEGAFEGVYAPNVYLVAGRDRAVFIDTAYSKDEEIRAHLGEWEAQGKPDIATIILTHRHGDHTGGAVRLREATGGPIACSTAEKDAIEEVLRPARVDRAVADGETIDLGGVTLEFVHTPGHTLGSLCVLYREAGVLFSGDMILGTGTTVIRPDHGDMTAYIESMRKLLRYDARIIAPGHGPVINTPQAKIQQLIEHRIARENQILELLQQGHRSIEKLFGAIYPDLHPGLHDTARSQVRAHLIKLERDGRVRASGDGYQVVNS
jgi:glyoxylase-like metal-dependent hydrolase (beta-lactamase superfamily II)